MESLTVKMEESAGIAVLGSFLQRPVINLIRVIHWLK